MAPGATHCSSVLKKVEELALAMEKEDKSVQDTEVASTGPSWTDGQVALGTTAREMQDRRWAGPWLSCSGAAPLSLSWEGH